MKSCGFLSVLLLSCISFNCIAFERSMGAASDRARSRPAVINFETCPKPEYPIESVRNEEEGTVTIEFQISATGIVGEAKILRSSGSLRLDESAVLALRQCEFVARKKNGKPVASSIKVQYVWEIDDNSAPATAVVSPPKRTVGRRIEKKFDTSGSVGKAVAGPVNAAYRSGNDRQHSATSSRLQVLIAYLTDRFAQPSEYDFGQRAVEFDRYTTVTQRRVVFLDDCTVREEYSIKKVTDSPFTVTSANGVSHYNFRKGIESAVQTHMHTIYIKSTGSFEPFSTLAVKIPCSGTCGTYREDGTKGAGSDKSPYAENGTYDKYISLSLRAIRDTSEKEVDSVYRAIKELVGLCAPASPPNPYGAD